MFDVLIREVASRFGLGDKALPLVQMLLAYMTNKDTGGLTGFLEKFKAAGLGPIVQSWLGGGAGAQPVTNSQLESVLGSSGGLLSMLVPRLGLGRDNITSSLGYLLPAIIGKLTPGGSIPAALPPEIASLASAGLGKLSAAPLLGAIAPAAAAAGGSSFKKWLPWLIVALAALFGLSYCGKKTGADAPAPATPPAVEAPAVTQPPAPAPAAAAEEPAGSAVVSLMGENSLPALKVYFDSGKTDVSGEFAAKASDLVSYLKSNPDVKAVISGYNDPTGDAAANAELSKNRAQAVQAALATEGIGEGRTVLEKPAEATATGATNAESRRVEVVIRK